MKILKDHYSFRRFDAGAMHLKKITMTQLEIPRHTLEFFNKQALYKQSSSDLSKN